MASLWSPGIFLVLVLALPLKTLPLVTLAETNVYIVYMGDKLHDEPELVQESHHELLADIVGSKDAAKESILYSYKHGFSGFAAVLTKSQEKLIAGVTMLISQELLVLFETELLVPTQLGVGIFYKSSLNLRVEFPRDIPGLVPSLVSWTQVYGQSLKASEMRVWRRCHLVGEGYAKKEKDSIARIVIGKSLVLAGMLKVMKLNLES
uniref:Inhibitor I9 domain-containing protein n=1 Tax=Salix viminalis TaxID=40686 RepID=A0A6N2LME5_SALVM